MTNRDMTNRRDNTTTRKMARESNQTQGKEKGQEGKQVLAKEAHDHGQGIHEPRRTLASSPRPAKGLRPPQLEGVIRMTNMIILMRMECACLRRGRRKEGGGRRRRGRRSRRSRRRMSALALAVIRSLRCKHAQGREERGQADWPERIDASMGRMAFAW